MNVPGVVAGACARERRGVVSGEARMSTSCHGRGDRRTGGGGTR